MRSKAPFEEDLCPLKAGTAKKNLKRRFIDGFQG